jgi:hypothetical protein
VADGDAHDQILTAAAIIPAESPRFDGQGESMARRYQKGRVILGGKVNSVWVGSWREDVIGANGVTRRIERSEFSAASREFPRSGSRSGASAAVFGRNSASISGAMDAESARILVRDAEQPASVIQVVQYGLWPVLDALKIPRCGLHAFRHYVWFLTMSSDIGCPWRIDTMASFNAM